MPPPSRRRRSECGRRRPVWRRRSASDRYAGRRALHSKSRHWRFADIVGRERASGASAPRARESLVDVDVMGHRALEECTSALALRCHDVSPLGKHFGSLPPFSRRGRFGYTPQTG